MALLFPPGPESSRGVTGFIARAATTTTIEISGGKCKDSADSSVITFTPGGGSALISVASVGALGIDILTSTTTGTVSGGTTVTATGQVELVAQAKAGLGTGITTSGTALTGLGTKWISGTVASFSVGELAVGDLIGNATNGWASVASISGDGSAVLSAALPGGNIISSAPYTVIENALVQVGTNVLDRRAISTLNAAGTVFTVIGGALVATGAGNAIKFGVLPQNASTTFAWLHLWARSGTSGVTIILSTQRTTPFTVAGYGGPYRRLGSWACGNAFNAGNDQVGYGRQVETSPVRRRFEFAGVNTGGSVIVPSTQPFFNPTPNTSATVSVVACPPTTRHAIISVQQAIIGGNLGTGEAMITLTDPAFTSTSIRIDAGAVYLQPIDAAQRLTYNLTNGTGNTETFISEVLGWEESL
jgi:hypothetical protein